jgi:hypothetical protein
MSSYSEAWRVVSSVRLLSRDSRMAVHLLVGSCVVDCRLATVTWNVTLMAHFWCSCFKTRMTLLLKTVSLVSEKICHIVKKRRTLHNLSLPPTENRKMI